MILKKVFAQHDISFLIFDFLHLEFLFWVLTCCLNDFNFWTNWLIEKLDLVNFLVFDFLPNHLHFFYILYTYIRWFLLRIHLKWHIYCFLFNFSTSTIGVASFLLNYSRFKLNIVEFLIEINNWNFLMSSCFLLVENYWLYWLLAKSFLFDLVLLNFIIDDLFSYLLIMFEGS